MRGKRKENPSNTSGHAVLPLGENKAYQKLQDQLLKEESLCFAALLDANRSADGLDGILIAKFQSEASHDACIQLELRLEEEQGTRLEVWLLDLVLRDVLALNDLLLRGRVLIDKYNVWEGLSQNAEDIHKRAKAEEKRLSDEGWQILNEMAGKDGK